MIDRSSPRSIVSLLSSATEMLYMLGLGDRIAAVSHECDYPPEAAEKPRGTICRIDAAAPSGAIDEEVRRRIRQGLPLYEIDVDLLVRLRPDLIVTQAQCDVCAVRFEDVTAAVSSTPELAATRVVPLNPASLDDVLRDIRRIGEAAGCPGRAEEVVADLQRRIARVQAATRDIPSHQKPRVACIEWIEPLMLAGNWMPQLLDLAGAAPGPTTAGEHSRYHAWQEVIDFQPEVIVVMPCGFDLPRTIQEAAALREQPGWSDLPAVRNSRVFAVDGNAYFNRAGP
ncbi:MAG: cobalamin-binding protein, partial [Planctomycetes bacterium]|nr:cobalamin-binding protein [Planctomycetota bacterium]